MHLELLSIPQPGGGNVKTFRWDQNLFVLACRRATVVVARPQNISSFVLLKGNCIAATKREVAFTGTLHNNLIYLDHSISTEVHSRSSSHQVGCHFVIMHDEHIYENGGKFIFFVQLTTSWFENHAR